MCRPNNRKDMSKHLNIISFNIPYPANYGGAIDIFYKLKALQEEGVLIILHCFEYECEHSSVVGSLCEKVYYYKQKTGYSAHLSTIPYNVYSRNSKQLIENLQTNTYPILFEGLCSSYYLNDYRLKNRFKIFRECNIKHTYFYNLSNTETKLGKKILHKIEAFRFKYFENVLKHANLILSVSKTDKSYLENKFPDVPVKFMPYFHQNNTVAAVSGKSDIILYHGNLSVSENEKAALFLIKNVFSKIKHTCMIAGLNPSELLRKIAANYPNVHLVANPSEKRMRQLLQEAHINVLVTLHSSGLKMKLLNTLFNGRHTVVNNNMLTGTGLDDICYVANTPNELIEQCSLLMEKPFNEKTMQHRKQILEPTYSNKYLAAQLTSYL